MEPITSQTLYCHKWHSLNWSTVGLADLLSRQVLLLPIVNSSNQRTLYWTNDESNSALSQRSFIKVSCLNLKRLLSIINKSHLGSSLSSWWWKGYCSFCSWPETNKGKSLNLLINQQCWKMLRSGAWRWITRLVLISKHAISFYYNLQEE